MKKRNFKGIMVVTALSLTLMMSGCSSKQAANTESSTKSTTKTTSTAATTTKDDTAPTPKKLKIGFSIDQLFESRVATIMAGEKAAEAAGCEIIELVADGDPQVQNNQIKTLLNQKIDGLYFCPIDMNSINTALMLADAAGVPAVAFDRNVPDSDTLASYSGPTAESDGYLCGKCIAESALKSDFTAPYDIVEFVGALNDDVGIQRSAGFKRAMKEFLGTNVNIISIPTNWDSQTALAGLQNAYQASPNICGIFCATDTFFPVCETVLSDLGKLHLVGEKGHVAIAGINGSLDAYTATVKGVADAMVVMNNGVVGKNSMNHLLDAIDGKPVPRVDIVPSLYYTHDNVEANKDSIWGLWDLHLSYQK